MKHWTHYWRSVNSLTSFAEGENAAGYQGSVGQFWNSVLARTENGASVLDIGTGNGALAVQAADFSRAENKEFTVYASDAAEIDPVTQFAQDQALSERLKAVQFYPQTRTEALPFDDQSIDLVTSQFAFEYAIRDEALSEVLRVLKPGGAMVALIHHQDSSVVHDSKVGLEVLQHTLGGTPLFIQADLLLRIAVQFLENADEQAWLNSQHAHATIKTTQWIMETLRERYSDEQQRVWVDDVISRVARLMQGVTKADAKARLQALAGEYNVLMAYSERLQDQIKAAWDKQALNAALDKVRQLGAKASAEPFYVEDEGRKELFAWKLILSKS